MFADLLKRLLDPSPPILPDEDARLAMCALLVRLARADDRYDDGGTRPDRPDFAHPV